MQGHRNFTLLQLQWLQEKQTLVDAEMRRIVDHPDPLVNEGTYLNMAFRFQGKLFADAHDMKIPQWAVPDVLATWNAIRNCEGKGPVNSQIRAAESSNSAHGGLSQPSSVVDG
ncbi:hypothetical protein PtB15_12B210 [Puccinia triticina]|nr:hypothetical protein PtB15_12B210 [Puccinia triticina]